MMYQCASCKKMVMLTTVTNNTRRRGAPTVCGRCHRNIRAQGRTVRGYLAETL